MPVLPNRRGAAPSVFKGAFFLGGAIPSTNMVEILLDLPRSYDIEEITEFPGTGKFSSPVFYIPPPKGRPEHDGLWLRITPTSGDRWIGVFAFGLSKSFSRVLSTFDPATFCVVSGGAGYFVLASKPDAWEPVALAPVTECRAIPEKGLLIFSDFTRLAAYGGNGLVWLSPRVCWDELKMLEVTGTAIEGIGYDPTNSVTHERPFAVDLKNGHSLLPSPVSTDGKPIW